MSTQSLTIVLSLLSLVGVILGAGLHYFFAKSGEKQKHLETLLEGSIASEDLSIVLFGPEREERKDWVPIKRLGHGREKEG